MNRQENLHINLFFMVNVGIRVAKSKPGGGTKLNHAPALACRPRSVRSSCFCVVGGLMVRNKSTLLVLSTRRGL